MGNFWNVSYEVDTGYDYYTKATLIFADNKEDAIAKFNLWRDKIYKLAPPDYRIYNEVYTLLDPEDGIIYADIPQNRHRK